jgi:tetratricopeptide (TPR) repeat protein
MRTSLPLLVLACLAATLAAAAEPAATEASAGAAGTPSMPSAPSAQQLYDRATAAADAGKCDQAVPLHDQLLARPGVVRNKELAATIRVNRGECLVLLGRFDEAVDALAAALGDLPTEGSAARATRHAAHLALGKVAYARFEYPLATQEFLLALPLAEPRDLYQDHTWIARAAMYEEGGVAIDHAAAALAIAEALPGATPAALSAPHTLHARALMNHGQARAAYDELRKALAAGGGLSLKITINDLVQRSDLALAAMLVHETDAARKYLAYTGTGRFTNASQTLGAQMEPPACGGSAGLLPDDYAVMEFGIKDDGTSTRVVPVLASRNGAVAAEFARAVSGWTWKPELVAQIDAFYRIVTRVELRCSVGGRHPDAVELLYPALEGWMAQHGLVPFTAPVAPPLLPARALGALAGTARGPAQVPVLVALGRSLFMPNSDRSRYWQQAQALLVESGAPPAATTYAAVSQLDASSVESLPPAARRAALRALLARPELAADARSAAVLRLLVSENRYGLDAPADAAALLGEIATDSRLAAADPLRVGALVRLANIQAKAGNLNGARQTYDQTGLNEQQCTLVDAQPALQRYGIGEFPEEAQRWGFEGWVTTEFDIRADGSTDNQRAVVAYPPLVFGQSATDIAKHTKYQQTFRPQGGAGCLGKRVNVHYKPNKP